MANNELKKLSRAELLEMLIEQSKEMEALKKQLKEANEMLEDRRILIENAGSIAEASLQLNGVFEAAQKAAAQYLENVQQQAGICADTDRNSRERAETLLSYVKIKCSEMESETQKKCERMVKNAQLQAQKYWDEVTEKAAQLTKAEAVQEEIIPSKFSDKK